MASIAIRFVFAVFAAAPGDGFVFRDFNGNRPELCSEVRAIAIWLILGIPAGAPRVFPRTYFTHIRIFLGNGWIHVSLSFHYYSLRMTINDMILDENFKVNP